MTRSNPRPRSPGAETAAAARRPRPPLGMIVRVTAAAASPAVWTLSSGRCVIGAGAEADIIVEDAAVSRRHVELTLCPQGVAVRDLDSRNGTFYLGQRIEKAVLSPGSRLQVGAAEVAIDADPSALVDADEGIASYRGLVGASEPMRKLFTMLARLEGSLVSVLIEGESGVGKELIADAIHAGSERAAAPRVVVNCGAIPKELVLSELFGHRKGSFTGAVDAREGAFQAADGGTLFLDEIGELDIDVQPALLRALESGEVKPVGETSTRRVSVRLIAATNRDLRERVREGRFREDLFYRLAVVTLRVPPLDERPDDIPLLVAELARQAGAGALPAEVVNSFAARSWPGNVRELRNALLAYLAIGHLPEADGAPGGPLELALGQAIDPSRPYQEQKDLFAALFSRIYFERLLDRTGGNQSEAARISKVERSYLGKLLSRYGVKR